MKSTQTAGKKLELSKKNQIQLAAMTVFFVIAAFLVYKTTIVTRMVMPRVETAVKAQEGKYLKLESGDFLEQTFRYHSDELLCAGTKISLEESGLPFGGRPKSSGLLSGAADRLGGEKLNSHP